MVWTIPIWSWSWPAFFALCTAKTHGSFMIWLFHIKFIRFFYTETVKLKWSHIQSSDCLNWIFQLFHFYILFFFIKYCKFRGWSWFKLKIIRVWCDPRKNRLNHIRTCWCLASPFFKTPIETCEAQHRPCA